MHCSNCLPVIISCEIECKFGNALGRLPCDKLNTLNNSLYNLEINMIKRGKGYFEKLHSKKKKILHIKCKVQHLITSSNVQ